MFRTKERKVSNLVKGVLKAQLESFRLVDHHMRLSNSFIRGSLGPAAHVSYREQLLGVPVGSTRNSNMFDTREKVARSIKLIKIHPHMVSYRLS